MALVDGRPFPRGWNEGRAVEVIVPDVALVVVVGQIETPYFGAHPRDRRRRYPPSPPLPPPPGDDVAPVRDRRGRRRSRLLGVAI